MQRPITIPTTGNLDKDKDLQYVSNGDYIHMQDFDFADKDVLTRTTTKGTKQIIDFGGSSLQNQKVRIVVNEPLEEINITLFDKNRYVKAQATLTTAGGVDSVKAEITNFITNLNYPKEITQFPGENYLEVVIGFLFADYTIEADGCSVFILREAISQTGVGKFFPIGSTDLLETPFYCLTNQRNLLTKLNPITNVVAGANNQIQITITNHQMQSFESIAVNSVVGVPFANGIWTVTVLNGDTLLLNNSSFSGAYQSGGLAYKNIYGYGCIGVLVEDFVTDNFNFIPLLRSKELNFVSKKEIYNLNMEINGDLISAYFTDKYNSPRAWYYRGEFVQDGCINIINENGRYAYGSINREIALQQSFTVDDIELLPQQQTGGALAPGNWRYAIRFRTDDNNETETSLLTNPIPVYSVPYEEGNQIFGNESIVGFTTGKINRVRVTGIVPGLFKFIELIAVNYAGGQNNAVATVAFIIRDEVLGEDQTEIILEHNGNEPDIRVFPNELLIQAQPNIVTVGDMVAIQNRMLLADIETDKSIDFRSWVDTFNYSIKREPVYSGFGIETFFEFYNPENVSRFTGYQIYEWYRFHVMLELQNGKFTDAYFFADIRFVNQNDYVWQEFESTNKRDKRDPNNDDFIDYTLGTGDRFYYQYHIDINKIDWSYQIEGVPVRDLVRSIRVLRAERIKEVEASGITILSNTAGADAGDSERRDFIYAVRTLNGANVPYITTTSLQAERRKYGAFYSPDVLFGLTQLDNNFSGYELISFGSLKINQTQAGRILGTEDSFYRIFDPEIGSLSPQITNINFLSYLRKGNTVIIQDPIFYSKKDVREPFDSYVFRFTDEVYNTSPQFDNAAYFSLVFRRRENKYGSANANNDVLYTGTKILVEETSARVFGGDVFTQQTWFKYRYFSPTGATVAGDGMNIISQNLVNTNLRVYNSQASGTLYPQGTQNFAEWLEFNPAIPDQITKNSAYSILNQIQYQPVYDPLDLDNGKRETRKFWSEFKPTGSAKDFYRVILGFNFADNPQAAGAITRVLNVNDRLFTLQERGFTLEYFNSQGQLRSADAGELLVGDGTVLGRVGNKLSSYGCQHRGAVVIGRSQSGKDILMYISVDYGNILRFGDDGLRSITRRKNMRLFFKNNLNWARNAKTPADGYGITGVWDNRQERFIFTVKAWKPSEQFGLPRRIYIKGQTVAFGIIEQGVPQLWTALIDNPRSLFTPNGAADWIRHEITDNSVYNCYTFTWTELKDGGGFSEFQSYLPNHYTQWNDSYISGFPDLDSDRRSELFLHNAGLPATYYGVEYAPFMKLVCNWQPSLNKKFEAIMMDASRKPDRINILTLFRNEDEDSDIFLESFLEKEDFETRESFQYSPIKLVTDANGRNDLDGKQVEGIYCTFEIIFPKGKTTTMNDLIVYIRNSFRNFTR